MCFPLLIKKKFNLETWSSQIKDVVDQREIQKIQILLKRDCKTIFDDYVVKKEFSFYTSFKLCLDKTIFENKV